ncbi:protein kinase [Streptomyces xiamenensis]|uniref:protein kinase domain-containing protein n=1 Tax=Streptomyces xiamenensis TaxID=408015 RepID=UPI0036C4C9EE
MRPLAPEDPPTIGGYQLLGKLGEGGMGQVYLARSDRGRTVAVKTVQPALAREPEFRRRFAQEITIARKVGGQWTAPVLDADTEADTPWVATGYIAGPALNQVVSEDYGPLPEKSVLTLASGLLLALRDIHAVGLVHRDLKPANVLITIDGPRVIDFGIARAYDGVTGGGLTRTGSVIGSPGFMSPEQIMGKRLSAASDVFCLGSVLAYAATGKLPFGTTDSGGHALMYRIVQEEPELEGVPDGPLHELISGCLHKDPEVRSSVDSLLELTGSEPPSGAWLPAEVLAQLGRHAVQLLDREDPLPVGGRAGPAAGEQPAQPTVPPAVALAETPPHGGPQAAPAYSGVPSAPAGFGPALTTPLVSPVPAHAGHAAAPRPPHGGPGGSGGHGPGGRPHGTKPVKGLAKTLTWLLVLAAVVSTFSLSQYIDIAERMTGWGGTDFSGFTDSSEIRSIATLTEIIGISALLLQCVMIVVWLVWFHRVRHNAEIFAPGQIRYGKGMAIGSWFIPIGMFFLPRGIARDIWRASHPQAYPSMKTVDFWWVLWALWLACLHLPLSWGSWHVVSNVEAARMILGVALVTEFMLFVASIAAIVFVQRLSRLQEQRMVNAA